MAVGAGLSIFSFFLPGIENSKLETAYVDNSILTSNNWNNLFQIPGPNNVEVFWNQYLYSAQNIDDVSAGNCL
jgi:hypothetical protein